MMEQYGGVEKQHQRFGGRNPFAGMLIGGSEDRSSGSASAAAGGDVDQDPWRGMVRPLLLGQEEGEEEEEDTLGARANVDVDGRQPQPQPQQPQSARRPTSAA